MCSACDVDWNQAIQRGEEWYEGSLRNTEKWSYAKEPHLLVEPHQTLGNGEKTHGSHAKNGGKIRHLMYCVSVTCYPFFIRKNHVLKPVIYHSVHSFYHLSGKKRQFRTACSGSWTSGKSCTAQRPERKEAPSAVGLARKAMKRHCLCVCCLFCCILCFFGGKNHSPPKCIPTIDSSAKYVEKVDSKTFLGHFDTESCPWTAPRSHLIAGR